jgi:argininosuccinate lyase
MPLGSGALAGSNYPIDRRYTASLLGFPTITQNSLDAVSDRDFMIEVASALAIIMMHLSRLSEELILWSSQEFHFVELPDAFCTGSSMMPQKKNPDPLELVRGKTGRTIGRLTGWLVTMKGLPSGYNKDLQEDKEAVFDAEATLSASLEATRAVVSRLSINEERSGRAASGLLLATDVADYLVSRGMPFRRAHEVVGAMVRRLLAEGRDFSSLTMNEWREASEMFGEDAPRAATALASVQARRTPQSTNPEAVRAALEECRDWVKKTFQV